MLKIKMNKINNYNKVNAILVIAIIVNTIVLVVFMLSKMYIFVAIEENRRDLLCISVISSHLVVFVLYSQYNLVILPV